MASWYPLVPTASSLIGLELSVKLQRVKDHTLTPNTRSSPHHTFVNMLTVDLTKENRQ
jgi:hypothetical protein